MDRSINDVSTKRKLQHFYISNHIMEYLSGFFVSFEELNSLSLINCHLNLSSVTTPNYLPLDTKSALHRLQLVNNTFVLKSTDDDTGMVSTLLKNLHLAPGATVEIVNNSLTIGTETAKLFSHLTNASHLSLRNTKFEAYTFVKALFTSRTALELQSLDLGNSDFPSDQSGIFAGMPNLESLKLDGTNLRMLGRVNLFEGMTAKNLTFLDLSHTGLRYLPEGLNEAGKNLLELHLRGNRLTTVKFQEIADDGWLANLRILILSDNQLTEFTGRHFQRWKNLRTLDISCNKIMNITSDMFLGLPRSMALLDMTFCAKSADDAPRLLKDAFLHFPPVKILYLGGGYFKKRNLLSGKVMARYV